MAEKRVTSHLAWKPLSGLVLLTLTLLTMSILGGCSDESQETQQLVRPSEKNTNDSQYVQQPDHVDPSDGVNSSVTTASYDVPLGSAGLNERVFDADIIARVRLVDTEATAERLGTTEDGTEIYRGVLQFKFEVLEYLKGMGGDELVVGANVELKSKVIKDVMNRQAKGEFIDWVAIDSHNPYTTMELAIRATEGLEVDRDTRWDDREAIILAREVPVPGSSDGSKSYSFGAIFDYTVDSTYPVWLPAVSTEEIGMKDAAGEVASDDTRFLLEEPNHASPSITTSYGAWLVAKVEGGREASRDDVYFIVDAPDDVRSYLEASDDASVSPLDGSETASVQPATISVSEIRELIAKLDEWREEGEGVEGHIECIKSSFVQERDINGYKERGESLKVRFDLFLDSGLPEGTVAYDGRPSHGRVWLEGEDKDLFEIWVYNNGVFRTTRPLPAGTYFVYHHFQRNDHIICNYYPEDYKDRFEWFVHVTAPEGTLHEAFFDPVEIGSDVGADASGSSGQAGVLEPASFEVEGVGATSIVRIAWESASAGTGEAGRVRMEFSPSAPPSGHHVDFIALDGTVALRLRVEDAAHAVEGDGTTLSWGVCSQPWEAGDKLMLRISESGPELSGVTNDAECPSSGQ